MSRHVRYTAMDALWTLPILAIVLLLLGFLVRESRWDDRDGRWRN
jgi:hypothetical protein